MERPRYAFFEGKIVPIEDAKVDIRTNALQYGTGIFEGIRGYWNGNRRTGCLALHPQDAAGLGIADGDFGMLTTKAGAAAVEIEISNLTTPGMAILPQGFGLNFNGRSVGVNVNRLTHASHRDPITAVPCHRRVPCRLEKTVTPSA